MSSSTPTKTFNPTTSKYKVTFGGTTIETTLTDRAATVSAWVRKITARHGGSPAVVGLDAEWRADNKFVKNNKLATLQLCINNKCLILQLFYMDEFPQSLKDFLLNPNFTFVGVEVEEDVKKLRDQYGLDCSRSMDLRAAAKARWPGRFQRPGLKTLARELFGLQMEKPEQVSWMSDWQARVLTEAQVEYACIDAFASYKIGHKLLFPELSLLNKFMSLLNKFMVFITKLIIIIISIIISIIIIGIISNGIEDSSPGTVWAPDDEAEARLL